MGSVITLLGTVLLVGAAARTTRTARDDACRQVSTGRHAVNDFRQHPAAPPSPTRVSPPPSIR